MKRGLSINLGDVVWVSRESLRQRFAGEIDHHTSTDLYEDVFRGLRTATHIGVTNVARFMYDHVNAMVIEE